jgi:hypothetical protein
MQKHYQAVNDAMREKCPEDVTTVWPNGKQLERMEQIKAKAAENAGPAAGPGSGPGDAEDSGSPFEPATPAGPFVHPFPAAGITVRQYNILLERIKRFCDQLKASGGQMSGGIRIPGTGRDIYWVYTPTEAATLTANNCQRVYDEVLQLI